MAKTSSHLPLFPSVVRKLASLPTPEREKIEADLKRALSDKAVRQLISRSPYSRHVADLLQRLLLGAAGAFLRQNFKGGLDLYALADFLALLASSESSDLGWVVKEGLKGLGIQRVAQKRGRPPGRKSDLKYVRSVQVCLDLIRNGGVWELRAGFRKKHLRDWRRRLDRELQKRGWASEFVDLVLTSRTPRALAISLTASHFEVSYDAIARACRRVKAAKK